MLVVLAFFWCAGGWVWRVRSVLCVVLCVVRWVLLGGGSCVGFLKYSSVVCRCYALLSVMVLVVSALASTCWYCFPCWCLHNSAVQNPGAWLVPALTQLFFFYFLFYISPSFFALRLRSVRALTR